MRETPVTVVGRLVTDMRPRRVGPNGDLVLNFRIASNERRFDKASQAWMNGDSLYLSVSCWRELAENAASLVKGDPVIVTGKLRTREWTTDQGERKSVIEMDATALGPDLARCAATVRKRRRGEPASTEDGTAEPSDEGYLSDGTVAEEATVPEQVSVPEEANEPEKTSLSDLAQAARPLVPA